MDSTSRSLVAGLPPSQLPTVAQPDTDLPAVGANLAGDRPLENDASGQPEVVSGGPLLHLAASPGTAVFARGAAPHRTDHLQPLLRNLREYMLRYLLPHEQVLLSSATRVLRGIFPGFRPPSDAERVRNRAVRTARAFAIDGANQRERKRLTDESMRLVEYLERSNLARRYAGTGFGSDHSELVPTELGGNEGREACEAAMQRLRELIGQLRQKQLEGSTIEGCFESHTVEMLNAGYLPEDRAVIVECDAILEILASRPGPSVESDCATRFEKFRERFESTRGWSSDKFGLKDRVALLKGHVLDTANDKLLSVGPPSWSSLA